MAPVVDDVVAVVYEAVAGFLLVLGNVLGGADVGHEKREHGEFALVVVYGERLLRQSGAGCELGVGEFFGGCHVEAGESRYGFSR